MRGLFPIRHFLFHLTVWPVVTPRLTDAAATAALIPATPY